MSMFCLYFFIWPLCCLSCFDLRIMITLLISSNPSHMLWWWNTCKYRCKLHQQSISLSNICVYLCTMFPPFFFNIIHLESTFVTQMWGAMISSFRGKHMNDGMFIEDLVTWRHYSVILENNDVILISLQLLDNRFVACKDQRENVQI